MWKNNLVNEKGKLIDVKYGNGIIITNTFDQYGFPTQIKHDLVTNQVTNLMTLNTAFETQRGNLTSRYNSMYDHQEEFAYDNLDRLTSWSNNNEIQNYTFTNATDGFLPTNTSVSIANETNQYYSRLKVTAYANFQGTQKTVKNNATVGEVLNISGQLFFRNLVDVTNYVKYFVVERNPSTGQTYETQYGINAGINFSFQHTVSQYAEISIKIVVGNDFNFQAPISFSLDNIKVLEVKTDSQTYDNLGRIDANNVGTYNYTNVNSSTNVPKHFQNTSVQLNDDSNSYFQQRSDLNITYNMFKSPVDIIEENHGKYSFTYNIANNRSSMYYGGFEENKFERPLHKHYSTDGSVEIKYDNINDRVEFITYIGGDAYSAPIVLKSDGTNKEYLYLHRDYLGSIVAISNQAGEVVEKRLFDAWGNIKKVTDGAGNVLTGLTVLDRGYTGHEHLQDVNLIHMNGRLYDPIIHRFLQPDNNIQNPYNTQNYNRYSYVFNNPLKYVDITGETGEDGPGLSNGQQTGIGAVISAIGLSYDFLTKSDWSKKNLNIKNWGNSINSAKNFIGRNLESIGGWFNKNFESFMGGNDMVYLASSPSFSNHQLSSGWQNEGFQSSGFGVQLLDGIQTGLDIFGLIPGLGEIADGTNALIYLGRGDYANAGLSAAAMIPFAGWGATGTKLALKADNAYDAYKATKKLTKYSDDLEEAAKILYPKKAGKIEKHHPFPQYMGGEKKQTLVPLNVAYHQQITNEFFKYWPKKMRGKPRVYPTEQQAIDIMDKVYSKFPLPGN